MVPVQEGRSFSKKWQVVTQASLVISVIIREKVLSFIFSSAFSPLLHD
jgi:hypothetical protein